MILNVSSPRIWNVVSDHGGSQDHCHTLKEIRIPPQVSNPHQNSHSGWKGQAEGGFALREVDDVLAPDDVSEGIERSRMSWSFIGSDAGQASRMLDLG